MSLEQIERCREGGKALSHRESQGRLCGGCHLRWAIKHGQCLYFKGILGGGNRIHPFIRLFIHLLFHLTSIMQWQWRRHCVWSQRMKSNKTRSLSSGILLIWKTVASSPISYNLRKEMEDLKQGRWVGIYLWKHLNLALIFIWKTMRKSQRLLSTLHGQLHQHCALSKGHQVAIGSTDRQK